MRLRRKLQLAIWASTTARTGMGGVFGVGICVSSFAFCLLFCNESVMHGLIVSICLDLLHQNLFTDVMASV